MKKNIALIIGLVLVLSSCSKWFNTDISEDSVSLMSPPNNHSDSLLTKTFWWEELNGAAEYQLQIVSPSFDSIVSLELDTILKVVTYTKTFTPGIYQWRVRGKNSDYESKWSTRTFTIVDTDNLSGQQLSNVVPVNAYASNSLTVNFSWDALSKATSYALVIKDGSNTTEYSGNETSNAKSHTFSKEGTFTWTLQAKNSISASLEHSATLTIDTTKPTLPTLTTFVNDTIKSFPATFQWGSVSDNGTDLLDSIFIGTTSNLSTVTLDTILTNSTNLVVDTLSPGNYYWRLGRKDKAGNYGGTTAIKSFVVK